jgi:hypothetical protein
MKPLNDNGCEDTWRKDEPTLSFDWADGLVMLACAIFVASIIIKLI